MKVSCRKAFSGAVLERARQNQNIWMVATDSRGSVTIDGFARELPKQFIEAGIAEQNAIAVAAGLSQTGRNVFVAGPACFLAARGYEQVKVDVAYNNSNVKIVGVSAGVSYGPLGGTHTSLHDFAGFRALPNLMIFAPSDAVQTAFLTDWLCAHEGPAYMRMGRGDVESVYEEGERFTIGRAKLVAEGDDVCLIACGEMVYLAKQAAAALKKEGIAARVLDMFTIKPCDEAAVIQAAKETKGILTIEEHSVYGGLGEMVSRITAAHHPTRVAALGFPDEEYKVGKSGELFRYYGLTPENIALAARKMVTQENA